MKFNFSKYRILIFSVMKLYHNTFLWCNKNFSNKSLSLSLSLPFFSLSISLYTVTVAKILGIIQESHSRIYFSSALTVFLRYFHNFKFFITWCLIHKYGVIIHFLFLWTLIFIHFFEKTKKNFFIINFLKKPSNFLYLAKFSLDKIFI